jgi:hypothetical protein
MWETTHFSREKGIRIITAVKWVEFVSDRISENLKNIAIPITGRGGL